MELIQAQGFSATTSQLKSRISGRYLFALLITGVLFLASGCGVKWWYGQSEYLLRYRINQYFDTTTQQADFISRQFKAHLKWHRHEGIPVHINFLVSTQKILADGLTLTEIDWFFEQYHEQLRLIVERLSSDSVQFISLLSREQIDHFSAWRKQENEKYEERLKMSREERLVARAEKTIEFLEDWLGSLSDSQEAEIKKMSLNLPDTFESWYKKKVQQQQQFISVLREHSSSKEIRQALHHFMLPPKEKSAGSSEPLFEMVLAVDRMVTLKQRQHLLDKLQIWIDDLGELNRVPSD